ncbi:TPA: hypothetical protein SI540_004587 [Escherichia coli]|nr:hypothetical protein [Escherichia coli]HEI2488330.1 hypothetical protein [Escherichia coli]HEI2493870.1 hypothetical protein [Escherichia coli]HEI2555881.1 hypothetical protein [Escherichia coli]HEI2570397.1 hypothetical protein [Escherichia coli]
MKIFHTVIISIMIFNVAYNANATDTTEFNVHLQQPTCDINVANEYLLGDLKRGVVKHAPFDVTISCDANAQTSLVVSVAKGNVKPDNQHVEFLIRGTSVPNGSLLSLEDESGAAIYVTGQDNICTGLAVNRTCSITPVTTVLWGNVSTEIEAVIGLKIIYI